MFSKHDDTSGVVFYNQAGRKMESKRALKNDAYAKLYQMIFEFWLAYADQKFHSNQSGKTENKSSVILTAISFKSKTMQGNGTGMTNLFSKQTQQARLCQTEKQCGNR